MHNDEVVPNPEASQGPFDTLLLYEELSMAHETGATERADAPGLWRGIGFRMGVQRLVSGINEVNEILTMPTVTPVPGTKPWLLGVANVRGNLITVVDMRGLLEGSKTPNSDTNRVLVIRLGGSAVGLLVDEVLGQRTITDESAVVELSEQDPRYQKYIIRHYGIGDVAWGVFSMSSLVSSAEFLQAAA